MPKFSEWDLRLNVDAVLRGQDADLQRPEGVCDYCDICEACKGWARYKESHG
jgi:hypothetical protein